jgi:hypothetical protein
VAAANGLDCSLCDLTTCDHLIQKAIIIMPFTVTLLGPGSGVHVLPSLLVQHTICMVPVVPYIFNHPGVLLKQ